MPDRSKRIILWIGSFIFCLLSATAVIVACFIEIEAEEDSLPALSSGWIRPRSAKPVESDLREQDFRFVWGKPLHRTLDDAAPVVEQVKPNPQPEPMKATIPFGAQLIATLVDADPKYARAWIIVNGKKQSVKVGDQVLHHAGQPIVTSISDRKIEVDFNGQGHTVVLPPSNFLANATTGSNGD